MRAFLAEHGLTADMQFGQLRGIPVRMVATDLNSGRLVLYGAEPAGSVLEGVLASAAVPPWLLPLERDDHLLFDGGALSNLPIEPALHEGATEVIALDLLAPLNLPGNYPTVAHLLAKLFTSVQRRQADLELALAAARNVPVWHLRLPFEQSASMWDFNRSVEMMEQGYQHARAEIAGWEPKRSALRSRSPWAPGGWPAWLPRLGRPASGVRASRDRDGQG